MYKPTTQGVSDPTTMALSFRISPQVLPVVPYIPQLISIVNGTDGITNWVLLGEKRLKHRYFAQYQSDDNEG